MSWPVSLGVIVLPLVVEAVLGCTTLLIGPGATLDRSTIVTSSGDADSGDFRLAKVPARKWPASARRPVFVYNEKYPHVLQYNRSATWEPSNLDPALPQRWNLTEPIGFVPQVRETFALFETGLSYGLMNEHQVVMGESTCTARFVAIPVHKGGDALLDVAELTKIALERSTTARDAIITMGALAERYGYYGAEWEGLLKYNEAGEAIPVADTKEAWVFHILPDDTGKSAIWCAQRLPHNHISVVANMFVIGEVDKDSEDFMFSANMHDIASKHKLWKKSDGKLHFSRVFTGPDVWKAVYSTRRVWRVFALAAPSIVLPSDGGDFGEKYPFSVPVDKKLSVQDVFRIHRDHYEGTAFDLTKGLAAGPYGDPDRYDPGSAENVTFEESRSGSFERSVGLFRSSYTYVGQSRSYLPRSIGPLVWFAPHSSPTSVFVPIHLAVKNVPFSLQTGSLFAYNSDSLFWRVCVVSNWVHRYYSFAIEDVRKLQTRLETEFVARVGMLESSLEIGAMMAEPPSFVIDVTDGILESQAMVWAREAHEEYAHLFLKLVAKYRDGFVMANPTSEHFSIQTMFYPRSWLEAVGFWGDGTTELQEPTAKSSRARPMLLQDPTGKLSTQEEGPGQVGLAKPGQGIGFWDLFVFTLGAAMGVAIQFAYSLFGGSIRHHRSEYKSM